jgi:hypothetical protein
MDAKDEIESVAEAIRDAFNNEASDSPYQRYLRAAKAAMLATLNAIREPTTNQFVELALTTVGRLGPIEEWQAMIDAKKSEIDHTAI